MEKRMSEIDLSKLNDIQLAAGAHHDFSDGLCVMEAVAYVASEPFSDHPECASKVLGAFMRQWNDDLPSDERTRLLKPLIPKLIGTAASDEVEVRRAWMVGDWFVREHLPAW